MKRTFRILLYYFSWQRTMTWTSGIGAAILLLALIVPTGWRFSVMLFGSVLALAFPCMFAGIAYRQLISNRRFVLVPELRTAGAAALLAFALISSLMVAVIAVAGRDSMPQDFPLDTRSLTLLAFSLISAYLLLSQWLVVYSLGFIGLFLLPLLALRITIAEDSLSNGLVASPWLMAALAMLGWLWLFVAARAGTLPRSLGAMRWEMGTSTDPSSGTRQWQPSFGPLATAAGTLLRGVRDGWQNRLISTMLALLTFPLAMMVVLWLIGAPMRGGQQDVFQATFFLVWSLVGAALQAELVYREWPARLRLLWLRQAGDRADAWRFVERKLLADVLMIGAVATVIAIAFSFLVAIQLRYLALYVAGCITLPLLGSYFGMLARLLRWHQLIDTLFVVFVVLFLMGNVAFMRAGNSLDKIYWLLPLVLAAIFAVRWLARRKLLKVDWCAVRPVQLLRKQTPQAA
jgi:hypothetical protein